MEGTWGFVSWRDVTSDIVEGQNATFYYLPSQPMQGWAGNAHRMEVKSFRAGRAMSSRDESATTYVEFVPRRGRKAQAQVQRSHPSLVIVEGWQHPDPPSGWVDLTNGMSSAKWPLFDSRWREEMDHFLAEYCLRHPAVKVLADYRENRGTPSSQAWFSDGVQQETPSYFANPAGDSMRWEGAQGSSLPGEVDTTATLLEGAVKSLVANVYERNPEARRRCIEHYGPECSICGFDFVTAYGDAMRGFIHVHHLKAISEIGAEYVVDPVADLLPVCPNCHAVIHSRIPQYTVDEVRALISMSRARG